MGYFLSKFLKFDQIYATKSFHNCLIQWNHNEYALLGAALHTQSTIIEFRIHII